MRVLLALLAFLPLARQLALHAPGLAPDARSSPSRSAAPRAPPSRVRMMGRSRAPKVFVTTRRKSEAISAVDAMPPDAAAAPPPRPPPAEEEVNPGAVAGTDLRVLEYPHPLLRAINAEVVEFDEALCELTKQMFLIMYASRGVGLAAPQLGVNKRLMVFNPEGKKEKWISEVVLCNPRIVEWGPTRETEEEGCLSFPGFTADVERAGWIKVEFATAQGKAMAKRYSGWEARIFQHEYDHLDGVLYVDRLSEAERSKVQPDLDRLVALHGPGGAI